QTALELRRVLLGPDHPDVAQSLLDHSFNVFEKGNLIAAEAEARQALAIFQRGNAKVEKILGAFTRLALFMGLQGKAAEEQAVADQAFALAKDAGYTEHPELAMILNHLVHTTFDAGDPSVATQLANRA